MRPPDKPAETECDGSSRIGSAFDEIAHRIFGRGGGHLGRLDTVLCGVDGLTIQVLNIARGLLQRALGLCLGVAGNASESFFYFAAEFFGGSAQPIFVHRDAPNQQVILDDLVLAFTRTRAYWPALTRR